ncbi:peptidoglycan-binding protein [Actinomadura terrae]|uniref:peptidoglycan-binding protein n=1 Tax=Actinomadura terrae TaxID=604353 RepID=UPI001FA73AD7|nr:peptidoglycan-binding protein [Actinomadura terrae]
MKWALVVGGVVVVGVGVGAVVLSWGGDEAEARRGVRLGTAVVSRGDLVDTEKVDGRLTYVGARDVWTGASGIVTWAPKEGATVRRGGALLGVAGKVVTLMYGGSPMYRVLKVGGSGGDVRQLERNLVALGYSGLTVDKRFTGATEAAVKEWQDDRGLEVTGAVDPGQVVFLGGAVRVRKVRAPEGRQAVPGQPVMEVSGTRRAVHVDLDADKQDLARKGAKVSVELPGGKAVSGTVTEVGDVAVSTGSGQDKKTTVGVDIAVKGPTGRLDEAPVTVELESERRRNVLSVPVEALLATREGGFAVEVADGTGRLVPVRIGAFGGGRVEVSGVAEGVKVGVPER